MGFIACPYLLNTLTISCPRNTNLLPNSRAVTHKRSQVKKKFAIVASKKDNGETRKALEEGGVKEKNGTKNKSEKKSDFWDSFTNGNGGEMPPDYSAGLMSFQWRDLLDVSESDNMLALALTGLLSWATFQILCQLFFVSIAIVVAALKYSLIAAILLVILITLL